MLCDRNGVLDDNMQGIRDWARLMQQYEANILQQYDAYTLLTKTHDHDHNCAHSNANSHELSSTQKLQNGDIVFIHRIVTLCSKPDKSGNEDDDETSGAILHCRPARI